MRNAVAMKFNRDLGEAPVGMTWRAIVLDAQLGVRMRQPIALPMGGGNNSMDDQQLLVLFMRVAPAKAKDIVTQLRGLKLSGPPKPAGTW